MNRVSDLNLALAVHEAGAMPSLQISRYNNDCTINYDKVNAELAEFVNLTGTCNLVLAVAPEDLFDYTFVKLINHYCISHVELLGNEIDSSVHYYDSRFELGMKYIKKTTKVLRRTLGKVIDDSWSDAICIKGKDSAGFAGQVSVSDLFDQHCVTASKNLIPYGGIGSPAQVKQYMDRGASAVAVGTLFAASKESCLSQETKLAMCAADSSQLTQFATTEQNALVLGKLESPRHDWNHEHDLANGIAGRGGLIYAGTAIDHVTSIRTVKEVVEYLVKDLDHA